MSKYDIGFLRIQNLTKKSNYDLNVTLWYNLKAKLLIPESIDWLSSSIFPCCLFFVVCPVTVTLSSAISYFQLYKA